MHGAALAVLQVWRHWVVALQTQTSRHQDRETAMASLGLVHVGTPLEEVNLMVADRHTCEQVVAGHFGPLGRDASCGWLHAIALVTPCHTLDELFQVLRQGR